MKTSRKTIVEFDEQSVPLFDQLKAALKSVDGKAISNKEAFLIALAYGFKHGSKVSEIRRSNTGVRVEYWKERDHVLMAAIQLHEKGNAETLGDLDERFEIAERYAQGGILLLKDLLAKEASFSQEFAAELMESLPESVSATQ